MAIEHLSIQVRAPLLPILGMLFASALCTPKVSAQATEPDPVAPITDCRSAASVFEQSARLPSGLLLAIGQVESGRSDPMTGRTDPWPWATNHAGEGHYFASAPEAITWVAAQQASGNRSIDVGCFQVNLQYHPNAFASLAEAFDPAANARYAAAFLNRLHEQSGNWPSAIALYHSADPFEGQRYSSRVMEVWNTGGRIAGISLAGGFRPGNPVVVRLSTMASAVRVVVPNWTMARPLAALPGRSAGLPRVITPGR
jgi:Transglycosylase SLT domain